MGKKKSVQGFSGEPEGMRPLGRRGYRKNDNIKKKRF
jgi:hypothetical protein